MAFKKLAELNAELQAAGLLDDVQREYAKANEIAKRMGKMYCQNCLEKDPDTSEGYTFCCNEPAVGRREMLRLKKEYEEDEDEE